MQLYEQGDAFLWTDPHIAQGMLDAHLNPEHHAASRKPELIAATVAWILHTQPQAGSLVDLGCGPGLYAEHFAQAGWQVLGLDINALSLAHARQSAQSKGLPIEYRQASYLEPFGTQQFDLATCIYCDFGALIPAQQRSFLANVQQALRVGGSMVLDVFGPSFGANKQQGQTWQRYEQASFWSPEPCYLLTETHYFAEQAAWGHKYIVIPDAGPRKTYIVWDHCFSGERITALLAEFGFVVEQIDARLISEQTAEEVLLLRARKQA